MGYDIILIFNVDSKYYFLPSLGYHAAIGSMATVLLDSCEEAKTENFLADTAAGKRFKNRLFTNSRYRQHIEMVLPWLYNRGAI